MAPPLLSLLSWLRGLFRRPGELLEFFSGATTLAWVALAWQRGSGSLPSVELLSQLMGERYWLWLAGAAATAQLLALSAHMHVARFISAILVGAWYAMLALALYTQIGLHPSAAMYFMAAAMNVYVLLHALEGRLR